MDLKRKYLIWKQNSARDSVFENVELISFHLPKTGGVSFRNALSNIYTNRLQLLYGSPFQERVNKQMPIWVPKNTRAIHGHFQPHLGLKKQFPNAKWVIWFRPPQERIVSHYNYWSANPQEGKLYKHFTNKIHTFKDFVTSKVLNNQVCLYKTYLRKVELNNFDFIGDLNHYDSEIKRFAKWIGVDIPASEKLNKSEKLTHENYSFDEEMLDAIQSEIEIYQHVKTKAENQKQVNTVFPNVEWISYHIPKTAGTSFYASLENEFGKHHILRAYDHGLAANLSNGNPIEIPQNIKVIHGHFAPHPNHKMQFPNAKKIIWMRDPIERLWSLLRHWTTVKNGRKYLKFKAKHITDTSKSLTDLFDALVKDEEFKSVTKVYETQFELVNPKDFAFVGTVENFDQELKKLSQIMGVDLLGFNKNQNTQNKTLPFDKNAYQKYFETEYAIMRKYSSNYDF